MTEAVGAEFLAERGLDPAPFQIPDDLRFCLAAGVALISAKMAHHENVEMFPRFGFFEMNNTGEGYDFYIY